MLLELDQVTKHFPVRQGLWRRVHGYVQAVTEVSLAVQPGEILGIVGESGCGKSTLARLIVRLLTPDHGAIRFEGHPLATATRAARRAYCRAVQMIFQDPVSSLNPRMTVGDLIAEPLVIHGTGNRRTRRTRVEALLDMVGLDGEAAARYPHEFSGGQRQRIGIARALVLEPQLLVADEPVSALDVSVQGEILNLLLDLQARLTLTCVIISHDLKVVSQVCDRVAVMYLGRVVEQLPAAALLRAQHPYTQALCRSVLAPDPAQRRVLEPLRGDVPSPLRPPSGCPFHPRCPLIERPRCTTEVPPLEPLGVGQDVACHVMQARRQAGRQ